MQVVGEKKIWRMSSLSAQILGALALELKNIGITHITDILWFQFYSLAKKGQKH